MGKDSVNIVHTLQPVFDAHSRVLILGTMPSPKSRELGFYYGHPQNRFWRVLALVLAQPLPESNEEKQRFVLRNGIALWDVLRACDIAGAQDSSIRNPEPNDIGRILRAAPIEAVFTTGNAATRLYQKLCLPKTNRPSIYLPSTSPANCARYPLERLAEAYGAIRQYL